MKLFSFLFMMLIFTDTSNAAGPEKIATLKRGLWPYELINSKEFDRASNAEIQMLTLVIDKIITKNETELKGFTGLKEINEKSIRKWLADTRITLVENHKIACQNISNLCATDWYSLVQLSEKHLNRNLSKELKPWYEQSYKFHQRYLYEQIRLAALFPRVTSEIGTLSRQEITGFGFNDGEFLLTYDDGPSNKRSAPLIAALNERNINAFFFVLGEKLKIQKPKRNLYRNQCLASHGYQHKSHQNWEGWEKSLTDTRSELNTYRSGAFWFRPPYGQRSKALLANLKQHNEKMMLWNIDSQDWNRKLTDQQIEDRVVTLMLLWRRGIILYHDIHSRALHNLNELNRIVSTSEKKWLDCRDIDT
ncbi:polysaccharide deacetylase family protein [Bermanella marisrubri]|uniref:Polysaccharide deacetylase family protein n=1 Tax=Bermanella marisrubri TaxID=207949 RepID=Q1MZL7_9GAMM|nr:polysaccharide deacetylase family protein [Bermanella marisrubri]EAT11394.1 polysaccharide deacetylase family protein [Oceanobacter sp. RED65] [Bermanella marisrubri]QIZ85607.1 polysaccharide deacetylase family protein [Bermanella marisrubri]